MLTKNFGRRVPEICSHYATIITSCARRALIPNGIHARVSHNDFTARRVSCFRQRIPIAGSSTPNFVPSCLVVRELIEVLDLQIKKSLA